MISPSRALVLATLAISLSTSATILSVEREASLIPSSALTEVEDQRRATVPGTIEALYEAFCFDPGQTFSTDRLSTFFLDDAIFVQPSAPGVSRKIDSLEKFYSDFRGFVSGETVQAEGIYEDVLWQRIDQFGDIAQALVAFQPRPKESGGPSLSRGLDSFQLVKIDERWWVTAMSTQFESAGHSLPTKFLPESSSAR